MEYLSNVLPTMPSRWTLSNATMSEKLLSIDADGSAFVSLTHDDVRFTPKGFKVYVKFTGTFDEFKPSVYAKLLIKDNKSMYQVFSVPFQVKSKSGSTLIMEAELLTACADFTSLLFQFFAEEPVEITEWKLYPSSDIDNNTLNTMEAMLPQFLFYFNETAKTVGTMETEIVNLPFAMGEAGNLSNHLLFNYTASVDANMTVQIKVDGSPEPYAPLITQVKAGPGYFAVPHSFLQVKAAAHLISVSVSMSAGSASIPAKGVRYTCEGRGILNGAGGEYPHAEVSDTYEYPEIVLGKFECHCSGDASLIYNNTLLQNIDRYIYPSYDTTKVLMYEGIPTTNVKKFGARSVYSANLAEPDNVVLYGNVILVTDGITFPAGVGEGIAAFNAKFPADDFDSVINMFTYVSTPNPNMRFAFGSDGSHWYTTIVQDGEFEWVPIELTTGAMSVGAVVPADTYRMDNSIYQKLFDITGSNKLTVAAYMISSIQQTSYTLNRLELYHCADESNTPLVPPTMTYSAGEDSLVRIHWQPPQGPPRAFKVYWGTAADSLTNIIETKIGTSYVQIDGLTNRQKYFAAATTLGYGRESEKSNIIYAVPTKNTPRWVDFIVSPSTISLQWMIIGVTYDSFNIYVGATEDTLELKATSVDMLYTLEDMLNNQDYYLAITGMKGAEESWFSDVRKARPMLPAVNVSKATTSKNAIKVAAEIEQLWSSYTGFDKYKVYYGLTEDTITNVVESPTKTILLTELAEDTQYYLYVVGVHGEEESVPTGVRQVVTYATIFLTALGNNGNNKPTQEQADTEYIVPITVLSGIQRYIVTEPGTYGMTVIGAAGGNGNQTNNNPLALGGLGARIYGEFDLMVGDELYCLVGQKGTDYGSFDGDQSTGSGGGMSVVAIKDDTSEDVLSAIAADLKVQPLIVAGAGNGGDDAGRYGDKAGADALLTEGTIAFLNQANAGGGFRAYRNAGDSGKSFLLGADAASAWHKRTQPGSIPGFGGGGGAVDDAAGGGGAGYNGSYAGATFGGSSFNSGANQRALLAATRVNGEILIQLLKKGV